jgi:hypothetical protein
MPAAVTVGQAPPVTVHTTGLHAPVLPGATAVPAGAGPAAPHAAVGTGLTGLIGMIEGHVAGAPVAPPVADIPAPEA